MESMVLTALYKNPPTAPPKKRYNSGAMTPSEVFSATVSTAARAMPASSNTLVSRPTIMETAYRAPSVSPSRNFLYTFMLSLRRLCVAKASQHRSEERAR